MNAKALRLGLSLMVVITFWSSRLAAQEVFVVPTVNYDPDHHPTSPSPFSNRPTPPLAAHLYKRILNQHGMACQPNPWGAVQNFRWEANWMFGSSRSWFFEQCVPTLPCAERREQR